MCWDQESEEIVWNFKATEYVSFKDFSYGLFNTNNKNSIGLRVFHINIRSLSRYFQELIVLLPDINPDFLFLTEVDVKEEQLLLFKIKGFHMYSNLRLEGKGGGIICFAKEKYTCFVQRSKLAECESLILDCNINNVGTVKLICVYRTPNMSKRKFLDNLETFFEQNRNGIKIYLGDINIDILKTGKIVDDYLDLMAKFNYGMVVKHYTREVVKKSKLVKSCLDHIFINGLDSYEGGVIRLALADHYFIGINCELLSRTLKHSLAKSENLKKNNS